MFTSPLLFETFLARVCSTRHVSADMTGPPEYGMLGLNVLAIVTRIYANNLAMAQQVEWVFVFRHRLCVARHPKE